MRSTVKRILKARGLATRGTKNTVKGPHEVGKNSVLSAEANNRQQNERSESERSDAEGFGEPSGFPARGRSPLAYSPAELRNEALLNTTATGRSPVGGERGACPPGGGSCEARGGLPPHQAKPDETFRFLSVAKAGSERSERFGAEPRTQRSCAYCKGVSVASE